MKKIIPVFALGMLMASCGSQQAGINLSGEWKVTAINGTQVPKTLNEPAISFDTEKSTFSGVTGVNIMNGQYKLSDTKLTFSDAPTTMMMADSISMVVEETYIKALKSVTTVSEENGVITLKDNDGKSVMTLQKKN